MRCTATFLPLLSFHRHDSTDLVRPHSDLFNTAEAFAIMSSVAFAASFTLGCFDLSRAKLSPRLRQQRLAGAV